MNTRCSFHKCGMVGGLALIISASECALPQPAPALSATKDAVLRNIVRDAVVPGYQELANKCHGMTGAVEEFVKAPTRDSLEKAREAWIAALLASRRIQWLQTGPIADREYIASFYFGKVLPVRIEEVLASTRAIDNSYLGEMGATSKGMFALEYLLFDRQGAPQGGGNQAAPAVLELFSSAPPPRRSQYLLALSQDLEAKARQVAADWTASGDQSPAAKFIAAGQDSLNRAVNQLAELVEQVAEQRIHFVLNLPHPISGQLDRIEGSRSGTSHRSTVALLQGIEQVYRGATGAGLEGYLKHLNASLAERVKGQIETTLTAVQAVGAPFEQAVPANRAPVEDAYQKTHALEVLCKVDLASALGVTITFNSNDGD